MKGKLGLIALSLFALLCPPAVRASSVFNFNSLALGTVTTFAYTQNGLTAIFSSPVDPGGFGVGPTFFAPPMGGNVLLDPAGAGANIPLYISFSSSVFSVSMNFATDGSGTFYVSAFENGALVGTVSAVGSVPLGYSFPQGTISFHGTAFNSLVLLSPSTPYFAIDNLRANTVATPEPSSLLLLGGGLLSLACKIRKRVV